MSHEVADETRVLRYLRPLAKLTVFSVLSSMDYARLGKMSNPEFLRGPCLDRSYFSYMSMICLMLQPDLPLQCLLMIQIAINVLNQSETLILFKVI